MTNDNPILRINPDKIDVIKTRELFEVLLKTVESTTEDKYLKVLIENYRKKWKRKRKKDKKGQKNERISP